MGKQVLSRIADDGTQIYFQIWKDESLPCRGLLQIVHGYAEWVDRYDEFANFMVRQGFLVFGVRNSVPSSIMVRSAEKFVSNT